jgi:hypothetical protein
MAGSFEQTRVQMTAELGGTDIESSSSKPHSHDGLTPLDPTPQHHSLERPPTCTELICIWCKGLCLFLCLLLCLPILLLAATTLLLFRHVQIRSMTPLSLPSVSVEANRTSSSSMRDEHRRGYLLTISEMIGPPETVDWVHALRLLLRAIAARQLTKRPLVRCVVLAILACFSSRELHVTIRYIVLRVLNQHVRNMRAQDRWPSEDAFTVLFSSLPGVGDALGDALRTPGELPEAEPLCHAVSAALARAAERAPFAPPLYLPLTHGHSRNGHSSVITPLVDTEPSLSSLEHVDATALGERFCGGIAYAPLTLCDGAAAFCANGWRDSEARSLGRQVLGDACTRDVVCVLSRASDEAGHHAAQRLVGNTHEDFYMLPPNTLLKIVGVSQAPFTIRVRRGRLRLCTGASARPGAPPEMILDDRGGPDGKGPWKFYRGFRSSHGTLFAAAVPASPPDYDVDARMLPPTIDAVRTAISSLVTLEALGYDEGATFERPVMRGRLLTCTATFMHPALSRSSPPLLTHKMSMGKLMRTVIASGPKFAEDLRTLRFLNRLAYVRGTSDLTKGLPHDMNDEWLRGDTWTDWAGVEYTGREIWAYVNGAAAVAQCTPGERDSANAGMRPEDFLARATAHMRARSPHMPASALLSMDEVLSLRIYTGPGFQPINTWLRWVGELEPAERRQAAVDASGSFGATTNHVISAIQKLAAVNTPEENSCRLFRGIRGQLPRDFWIPDDAGYVCASDTAFMSTSTGEATPIHYMAGGTSPNLLWELRASSEDEAGFHCGADVSLLSQFAGEKETIFPPMTMLKVIPRAQHVPAADAVTRHRPRHHHEVPAPPSASSRAREQWARVRALVRRAPIHMRLRLQCSLETQGDKTFDRVVVVPTFTG